jgi:ADP-ribosylglycohydrolase
MRSRVRGCILGAALGDAIGGPFEFAPLERVRATVQSEDKDWIDGLYPYMETTGPHGVWGEPSTPDGPPPAGTGTDDTRYNWLLIELASELGHMPTGYDLAQRYIEIYGAPGTVFPGHAELTRQQFAYWEGVCRGYLNQASYEFPDLSPELLRARKLGLNFPILSGLITLTSAGLLYPGRPEEAYTAAFLTAFYDIGYAREAVALLAAAISLAVAANDLSPQALFERAIALDPLHLGGEFSAPFCQSHLASYARRLGGPSGMASSGSDREVAYALSVAFRHLHTFDPFRTLGIAFLAFLAAGGDPLRTILIAVNHVGIPAEIGGARHTRPSRYEDIDCYGSIAGALAGAFAGADAFPSAMLARVTESNKRVYGVDLDAAVERFVERFYA